MSVKQGPHKQSYTSKKYGCQMCSTLCTLLLSSKLTGFNVLAENTLLSLICYISLTFMLYRMPCHP